MMFWPVYEQEKRQVSIPIPQIPNEQKSQRLSAMFPEYDIDSIIQRFPQQSAHEIAEWIASTHDAPKQVKAIKKRVQKEPDYSDDSDVLELKVLNMLQQLLKPCATTKANARNVDAIKINCAELCRIYPMINPKFVEAVYRETKNSFSVFIAIWVVAHGFELQLKKRLNRPSSKMWTCGDLIDKKDIKMDFDWYHVNVFSDCVLNSDLKKFQRHMNSVSRQHSDILMDQTLLVKYSSLNQDILREKTFECVVCYEHVNVGKMAKCGTGKDSKRHSFCRDCVREQALAVTQEMPLAEGAVGFKCMDQECKNPIYYSKVRLLICKNVRRLVDDRICEENLMASGLNLERCNHCNYAVEMPTTAEEQQVFKCPECLTMKCRKCHKTFDAQHVGVACSELVGLTEKEKKERELAKQISEICVRRCHSCKLQFVKLDGCNLVHCRCGVTQCYVCKKSNVNYNHFCRHFRVFSGKCRECSACELHENVSTRENEQIKKLQLKLFGSNALDPKKQQNANDTVSNSLIGFLMMAMGFLMLALCMGYASYMKAVLSKNN